MDILQSLYFGTAHQVVAPQGDANIVMCPGKDNCPYERREEEEQERFERATGISCGKEARAALRYLLEEGHFTRKQLASAWRADSLVWDVDRQQLRAAPSRLEEIYGMTVVLIGAAFLLVFVASLVITGPTLTLYEAAGMALIIVAFGIVCPFAATRMVRPNRIARRARQVVTQYYAQRRET